MKAGRLVLQQLDQLAAKRVDFAFETTFSGLGYVRRIRAWKRAGYKIEIVYLKLQSTRLALTICGHRPFGECLVPVQIQQRHAKVGDIGEASPRTPSRSVTLWRGVCSAAAPLG